VGYRRPDGADPPEDSYSRVTEPERFVVVVEAADVLVARLVQTYAVVATPAELDGALLAALAPAGDHEWPAWPVIARPAAR